MAQTQSNNSASNQNLSQISAQIKSYVWWSVTCSIAIGLIMIGFESEKGGPFWDSLGAGVLIAGGSLLSGGLLGFIFGIPSVQQNSSSALKYNDNLVQISDWLTKIIVGVGLTQLYKIPHFVLLTGQHFRDNFGGTDTGRNIAISIIGYFSFLGFLMIFFWTKTDYTTMMDIMDSSLSRKLDAAELETKNMSIKVAQTETKSMVTNSESASDTNSIGELKQNSSEEISNELDRLKETVNKTLPTKTITVTDDLQKNRWGGKSENNGKKLSATVTKDTWQSLFDVLITVSNSDASPLKLPVAVFLHDSYKIPNDVVYITPNDKGLDQLPILAYEAFTLGALFADGTELELDLNNQTGYPSDFYWKK